MTNTEATMASNRKIEATLKTLLAMPEMSVGERFGYVVERGRLSFRVHGTNLRAPDGSERVGPMEAARFLADAA